MEKTSIRRNGTIKSKLRSAFVGVALLASTIFGACRLDANRYSCESKSFAHFNSIKTGKIATSPNSKLKMKLVSIKQNQSKRSATFVIIDAQNKPLKKVDMDEFESLKVSLPTPGKNVKGETIELRVSTIDSTKKLISVELKKCDS